MHACTRPSSSTTSLYLMNTNYSHSKASYTITNLSYLSLVSKHLGSNYPTSKTSWPRSFDFHFHPERDQWPSLWRVGVTIVEAALLSIASPAWTNDVQCSWVAQRLLTPPKLFHGHWRSSNQIRERKSSHISRCGDAPYKSITLHDRTLW